MAAEAVLANQNETRLKLVVAGNLALAFVLSGQIEEAEVQLSKAWEICDEVADIDIRQHLYWTQGLIHRARDDLEEAASEFEKAQRGFNNLCQPGYRAMVALELALVGSAQGRFGETGKLAATAIPVLKSFQHDSGVSVALKVLSEAMAAQQVTCEVLKQVHIALYFLWRNPSLDLGAVKPEDGPGQPRPQIDS